MQPPFPHGEHDMSLVCTLLKLLDRKKALVDQVRTMNMAAEKIKHLAAVDNTSKAGITTYDCASPEETFEFPESLKHQYACVVVQLERTSQNLEATLAQLRRRRSSIRRHPVPLAEGGPGGVESWGTRMRNRIKKESQELVEGMVEKMVRVGEIPGHSSLSSETGSAIKGVIVSSVTLVSLIKKCVEHEVPPVELDVALRALRPAAPQNQKVFQSIEEAIAAIRTSLSSS